MKTAKHFIVLTFILLFNNTIISQEISIENKSLILEMLQSENYSDRLEAIGNILQFNIPEAVSIIEENIHFQDQGIALQYLRALDKYNAPNFLSIAHQLLNNLDTMVQSEYQFIDSAEIKVRITQMLFDRNDFTTVSCVFNLMNKLSPNTFIGAAYTFEKILTNMPEYELESRNELNRIALLDDKTESYNSIYFLLIHYKNETVPLLEDVLVQSSYRPSKVLALDSLIKYGSQNVENIMRNRLVVDPEMTTIIAKNLLNHFPSLYNYNFIYSNLEQIPNNVSVSLLLIGFSPLAPESSTLTNDLLNNLNNYVDSVYSYNWLGDLYFSNELKNILTTAKTNLQNGDSLACRVQVKAFQDLVDNVYKDSLNADPRFVTIEGWKFLYWNAQYILDRLPEPPANPNLLVNLKNSLSNQIPASNVKYYEGSWKDAVDNGDGTFTVITTRATVSIRIFYEYASQQVDNVPAQNNTYTFTTLNAAVQLKNSLGNFIDAGTVQYYAGAWRTFGTTSNGVATKELLPINYSFRMTYEYGSIDKQQDISSDQTVIFQTVNASVQLKNSLSNLIDVGTVQYYAGAWRSFGTTSNGVVYKELLPVNYSFRMTYEYVSKDKQQNLSTNPVVDFSTVLCSVKVSKTSNNQPINNAAVKYYSLAWRDIGLTNADGITTKELLTANLSFRASFGNVSLDKQQDISVNNLVEILLNVP